jgi:hypothetical protein
VEQEIIIESVFSAIYVPGTFKVPGTCSMLFRKREKGIEWGAGVDAMNSLIAI